eukprot:8609872-Pyramimonas_sp.AAC.1
MPLVIGILRKVLTLPIGPMVCAIKHAPFFGIGLYIAYSSNMAKSTRLERTAVAARVGNVDKDLLGSELLLAEDEKETWVANQDGTDYLPWLNGIVREFWPLIGRAVAGEVKAAISNIMQGMGHLPLSLQVQEFTLGDIPPTLNLEMLVDQPANVSRVKTANDTETVAFDIGLEWNGDPDIKLS